MITPDEHRRDDHDHEFDDDGDELHEKQYCDDKHDGEHHNDLFTIGIEHRDDFKDASLSQCVRFDAVTGEEIQHTL